MLVQSKFLKTKTATTKRVEQVDGVSKFMTQKEVETKFMKVVHKDSAWTTEEMGG